MPAHAKHIFDTFEYFWVDHKSKFFYNCLVTRWRHIAFAENWNFELKFFYAQKIDCFTVLLATKWVSALGPFRPIFGQKIDPKLPRSHFFLKSIHQKNFSSKFQFSAKAMMTPPGDQTVTKKFWLVVNSEIFKGIKNMFSMCGHFFRVTHIFKPTVFN